MPEITVSDPESMNKKKVPDNGQVYVGKDLAGKEVSVIVKVVEEDSESDAAAI